MQNFPNREGEYGQRSLSCSDNKSGSNSVTESTAKEKSSLDVLALVTDAFGGAGGIAQYNRDLLSALASCECINNVVVLPRTCAMSPGVLPVGVRQLPPLRGRIAYSLGAFRAARSLGVPDIVFCGHLFMVPLAALVAKLFRARLWIQIHGIEAWQELSLLHQHAIEMGALVTSVSRFTRRQLLRHVAIDPSLVKILPNTVAPRFQPGPKPSHLLDRYRVRGKKILLTVSRLARSEQYKGHDRVIRALPQVLVNHPDAIYFIVGEGDDQQRLEALSVQFGVANKVQFVGPVNGDELPDYFRLADVFVMPSTGEGFGIVFLEAMASGLRVIGGNQDGSLDALCNSKLATAVSPDNSDELILAINNALIHSIEGCHHAHRFKFDFFAEHLNSLVQFAFSDNRRSKMNYGERILGLSDAFR